MNERNKSTINWSTLNGSPDLLIGETVASTKESQTKVEIGDHSTLHGPPGLWIGEMMKSTGEQGEELSEPSWGEAAQRKLLESELQGIAHRKSSIYIPLEPLVESADSSWGESAKQRLFESELTGKGFKSDPKDELIKENKSNTGSTNARTSDHSPKDPIFKNVGFVNRKWTEILVGDEEECDQLERDEVKKAIIQMSQREIYNPIDSWTDKCIRVKHKTYVPVQVNKDRNGRMIYTPLKPTNKPEISFGAEIRTPRESDNEDQGDEITEVEYPRSKRTEPNMQNQDVKVNVDINIINQMGHISKDKSCQMYKSLLTKRELIKLIKDEIK